jgi:hypothetical protein
MSAHLISFCRYRHASQQWAYRLGQVIDLASFAPTFVEYFIILLSRGH